MSEDIKEELELAVAELESVKFMEMKEMPEEDALFSDIEMPSPWDDYSDEALFGGEEKSARKPKLKDPKGGLTAAGRAHFKRTQGANLKPGVKGPADTPEKMRRKGSFLTRFFTNPSGPMKDDKGRATRLALSAAAWGEPVPKNTEDAAKLAAKGRRLLERYENTKTKKKDALSESSMSDEQKVEEYINSLTDEEFDKTFPDGKEWVIPEEHKWLFDTLGGFLRRAVTGRRKKKKGIIGKSDTSTELKAAKKCPEATGDIAINLKNRKNAIDTAMYGPLNPAQENEEYWYKMASEWDVSPDEAKKQRCGNCAVFIVTPEMKSCIEGGLVGDRDKDEWEAIDSAGELGYCEAFDFKCASKRTCRAWVTGGPIKEQSEK
jgi:Domain of unknown function (DUF6321)